MLIADEPTTALDVTIQAQIIDLVKRLRDELGMAIIWITHDLGIVAGLAERVMVMYAGYIVEEAPVKELYANPHHPYTLGLLGSLPRLDETRAAPAGLDRGTAAGPAATCPRAARLRRAAAMRIERCSEENPPLEAGRAQAIARPAGWILATGEALLMNDDEQSCSRLKT